MRKKAFALAMAALLLCSCGAKQKKEELPEDTPYNHGGIINTNTIMETESGYYTGKVSRNDDRLSLRYYERDTEKQIYLCAKPECLHDGSDSCTATYKNLTCISSILYNGSIYNLTLDEGDPVTLSIYKASLDGTSLTKVGDVFSSGNSSNEEEIYKNVYFIIHKGYAYISYWITLSSSQFGFAGSGIVKMDISNGKTEQLYTGENFFSSYAQGLSGSGNYFYYSMSGTDDERGFYRYNTKTGETERIWNKLPSDNTYGAIYPVVGERKIFITEENNSQKWDVYSCGKERSEMERALTDGFDFVTGGFEEQISQVISYEDKIMVVHGLTVSVFSEDGETLGEISCDLDDTFLFDRFSVFNGKLYFYDIFSKLEHEKYKDKYEDIVYSCPIEDIVNGKGKWKFEYGVKSISQINSQEMGNIFSSDDVD